MRPEFGIAQDCSMCSRSDQALNQINVTIVQALWTSIWTYSPRARSRTAGHVDCLLSACQPSTEVHQCQSRVNAMHISRAPQTGLYRNIK